VGVEWLHDEAEALAQAAAEGKPVMIDFTADWCAACKELEHLTYPDARIVAASAGFVPVMIDATRSDDPIVNALLKKYDVGGLPMIHFLRPDGSLIEGNSVSGFKTADDFLPHMEHALAVVAG
jgi:thiol:disulfide interchange protein DsbD